MVVARASHQGKPRIYRSPDWHESLRASCLDCEVPPRFKGRAGLRPLAALALDPFRHNPQHMSWTIKPGTNIAVSRVCSDAQSAV